MSDHRSWKSWRFVVKLVLAGVAIGAVFVTALKYQEYRRHACDRSAAADAAKLSVALERLHNELAESNCSSEWKFEEKQLTFLLGPYYGWRGTTVKCKVKLKVLENEYRLCAVKGTRHGSTGEDRMIYRYSFPEAEELPGTVGPCYGTVYGGSGALCFTESMVGTDCNPRYKVKAAPTPEEEAACKQISGEYGKNGQALSELARTSINHFGIALYKVSGRDSDNFFFGPLTAYAQFFTTAEITRGETQQEILRALGLKEVNRDLRRKSEQLIKAVRCSVITGGGQFSVTDEFMGGGEDFFRPFDTALKPEKAGAAVERDPQRDAPKSASVQERAETVDCPADTDINLGWKNVTYFLGIWGDGLKFDPSATLDSPFFQLDGKQVTVPMMFRHEHGYLYMEDNELQALQIPYGGGGMGMLILLPRDKKGLPRLEESLTAERLHQWTSALAVPEQSVKVWIPRFGVSAQTDWTKALGPLPIRRIFSFADCQLDRDRIPFFVKQPELRKCPSRMSFMGQQAWIEVNEKGTEAYVAGVNCNQITSSNGDESPPPPPIEFNADHPFLFIVRHIPSGAIAFMGRYAVP